MRLVPAIAIFASFVFLTPATIAQQTAPADAKTMMKSVVIPASDTVFAVGKAVPKSEQEWAAIRDAAAKLGDAGRQFASQAPAGNGADWTRFAKAMADAAASAGRAAQAKNVDAVLDAGDALYESCEGCHQRFMKK